MVSFSITEAHSEKAKKALISYTKQLIEKNPDSDYNFCKTALDNSGNVFQIVCTESYDEIHPKLNDQCVRCKLDAFSVDEYGRILPLATFTGILIGQEEISYADRLDSLYENNGIGREIMLFWETLVYENTNCSSIDMVAINGEKNISLYERLGYSPTVYFVGDQEIEPVNNFPMDKVEGAFMTKDLTIMDFFKHKAALKSASIYESSPEETKIFMNTTSEELREYRVKNKRHVNPEALKNFKNKKK